MYFQRRGSRYSFIYYDTLLRKNVRLNSKKTSHIETEHDAEQFCKKWDEKNRGLVTRKRLALEWKQTFKNWTVYVEHFQKARQEQAPNSWENELFYLEAYIFPFFLRQKGAHEIVNWENHFEDFREHLLITPPVRHASKKRLAYSTCNNIISALNAFIRMMYRRRILKNQAVCRYFEARHLSRKSVESVLSLDEQRQLFQLLRTENYQAALFFWIAVHSGLRFNEQLGLSLADVFEGSVETPALDRPLAQAFLAYRLFIALDSQPVNAQTPRNRKHEVCRKPLKGKQAIDYANSRVIPIFDEEASQYLAELRNAQFDRFEFKRFGENPKDYLLFPDLTKSNYSRFLRQAQKGRTHVFTPHDTRHTYSTWLAQATGGNFSVCQMILGHGDPETTLRYIHVNAELHQRLRLDQQLLAHIPENKPEIFKNNTLPIDIKKQADLKHLSAVKA